MGGGRGKGPMGNRGGMNIQRGRNGLFMNSGGGRSGQQPLRGHGSRGSFGKQDFHGRRGGSFNAGHHQGGNASFRGRGHGQGRSGRHDGPGPHGGNRDVSTGTLAGSGKKDENRRTLTDFKIIGLEIPQLEWSCGVLPAAAKAEKELTGSRLHSSFNLTKEEPLQEGTGLEREEVETASQSENGIVQGSGSTSMQVKAEASLHSQMVTPPPSRIRIYFHTPVSPDDSRPIPHNSAFSLSALPVDLRKGKRKKVEDDEVDAEDDRERLPLPQTQTSDTASNEMDGTGRASAAPSVAETASEGDWLLAAIAADEADIDAHGDDEDLLCVSQIEATQDTDTEAKMLGSEDGVISDGEFLISRPFFRFRWMPPRYIEECPSSTSRASGS